MAAETGFMELTIGVHALPIDARLDERELRIHPAAVETPRGPLLLDVGFADGVDDLEAALGEAGLGLDDAWAVVVTHHDLDHAGCLAAVVDRTDALVFAHEAEAPYLEGRDEPIKSSADRPIHIEPTTVDVQLVGGEVFDTVAGPMRLVHTPGHTPGHTSAYFPRERLLVAADALTAPEGDLAGPNEDATADVETAWESVAALSDLLIDDVLCYHGGHVRAGTDRLDELVSAR